MTAILAFGAGVFIGAGLMLFLVAPFLVRGVPRGGES